MQRPCSGRNLAHRRSREEAKGTRAAGGRERANQEEAGSSRPGKDFYSKCSGVATGDFEVEKCSKWALIRS